MTPMGLDIRRPLGLLFLALGALLVIYGFVADPTVYQRSLGINVNTIWGACLFVFGGIVLFLGSRGKVTTRPAETTPEGRATEDREHRMHLEENGGH